MPRCRATNTLALNRLAEQFNAKVLSFTQGKINMIRLKKTMRAGLAAAILLSGAGCAVMYNSGFEARYYQKNIVVNQVTALSDNQLRINYQVLNETVWSSPGVDYAVRDDALYITPVRCYQRQDCSPQLKNSSGQRDQVTVTVPYRGGPVYLVYEDGEKPLAVSVK